MMSQPIPTIERNLATMPGVKITVSNMHPTGGGARNPAVLLNEQAHRLDGHPVAEFRQDLLYDTFHGRDASEGLDWYVITFPELVWFNCIEMTMGLPFRDGGWWTSLAVEVRAHSDQPWMPVRGLHILPDYDFSDSRSNRRPYQTFLLAFGEQRAQEIRVIGTPGGLAGFTSLARLAVYHRELSRWNPLELPPSPVPDIYRLISPGAIFDLSESLVKVTGLDISLPMLEYFLDEGRFSRFWARMQSNYLGKPQLWILIGDTLGWGPFLEFLAANRHTSRKDPQQPGVDIYFGGLLVTAYAPTIVDGHPLGFLSSTYAVLKDDFNLQNHKSFANKLEIPWDIYRDALDRSPCLSLEQMEGMAQLMGVIANTIAGLAHRNLILERELVQARTANRSGGQSRMLAQRAIDYMEAHLEEEISIAEIARSIGLSPAYFSTLFSEQMGSPPNEFLGRLRIERAKEYFGHTNSSVMDVCVALNYTPSYFNRLFKRLVGMTPGEYARQARASVAADSNPHSCGLTKNENYDN